MSRAAVKNKVDIGAIRCLRIYPIESPHETVGLRLSNEDAFRLAIKLMVACREGHDIVDVTAFRGNSAVTLTAEQP